MPCSLHEHICTVDFNIQRHECLTKTKDKNLLFRYKMRHHMGSSFGYRCSATWNGTFPGQAYLCLRFMSVLHNTKFSRELFVAMTYAAFSLVCMLLV